MCCKYDTRTKSITHKSVVLFSRLPRNIKIAHIFSFEYQDGFTHGWGRDHFTAPFQFHEKLSDPCIFYTGALQLIEAANGIEVVLRVHRGGRDFGYTRIQTLHHAHHRNVNVGMLAYIISFLVKETEDTKRRGTKSPSSFSSSLSA